VSRNLLSRAEYDESTRGGISTRVALVMTQRELAEDDSNVPNKAALQQHRRRSNCTRFVTVKLTLCILLFVIRST